MELILEGERNAMQWTDEPLMFFEVVIELLSSLDGFIESNLKQKMALETRS